MRYPGYSRNGPRGENGAIGYIVYCGTKTVHYTPA